MFIELYFTDQDNEVRIVCGVDFDYDDQWASITMDNGKQVIIPYTRVLKIIIPSKT